MQAKYDAEKEIIASIFQLLKDYHALQVDRQIMVELQRKQYSLVMNMKKNFSRVQYDHTGKELHGASVCTQSQKMVNVAKACHLITLRSAKRIRRRMIILLERASPFLMNIRFPFKTESANFSTTSPQRTSTIVKQFQVDKKSINSLMAKKMEISQVVFLY